MTMDLWERASHSRLRRVAKVGDYPLALLLSAEDARVQVDRLRRHLVMTVGRVVGDAVPLPGSLGWFEGFAIYAVDWLPAGSFAWAWP